MLKNPMSAIPLRKAGADGAVVLYFSFHTAGGGVMVAHPGWYTWVKEDMQRGKESSAKEEL